jgi:heme-degrading monooxygenase HmoA
MHARVVTVQIQPGKMDELIDLYRGSIAPAAKEQKGSKGAFLLTNPDTNKAISITVWETKADMTAGEASGYYQEQVAKAAPTFAEQPAMEHYSVSVQS